MRKLWAFVASVVSMTVVFVPQTARSSSLGHPIEYEIQCFYSGETAQVDPITAYGQTSSDHLHDFYGTGNADPNAQNYISRWTTPNLTAQHPGLLSLSDPGTSATGTNCKVPSDDSGYWTPTMFCNQPIPLSNMSDHATACDTTTGNKVDAEIHPNYIRTYWTRGNIPDGTDVNPLPDHFGFVVGNSTCNSLDASCEQNVRWTCGGTPHTPYSDHPYDCTWADDHAAGGIDGVVAEITTYNCLEKSPNWTAGNIFNQEPTKDNDLNRFNISNDFAASDNQTGLCPGPDSNAPLGYVPVEKLSIHVHFGIWNPCKDGLDYTNGCGPSALNGDTRGKTLVITPAANVTNHLLISLSSGEPVGQPNGYGDPKSIYSMHADYLLAWNTMQEHKDAVSECLNNPTTAPCNPLNGPDSPFAD
jgi:Domain of unknown function (DUF1996)